MEELFEKIIVFSSEHLQLREDINLVLKDLTIKQIIYFKIIEKDREYIKEILEFIELNNLKNSIDIIVDDEQLDQKNISFVDFDETAAKITLSYSMTNTIENMSVLKEENFINLIRQMVINLKLSHVNQINSEITVFVYENKKYYKLYLKIKWLAFSNDDNFLDKSVLVLPQFISREVQKYFMPEILKNFIDLVAERNIKNDYLIRLGDSKTIKITNDTLTNLVDISNIYSIIKFIFDDDFRYDDKLKMLRKVLSETFTDTELVDIKWLKVLQALRDNYSLFIDSKLESFIKLNLALTDQVLELSQKINKNIDDKIDDFSKQIALIVATVISSFIIKIGGNLSQLILIISAIIYTLIILIFISLKGVHFSSDGFEKSKLVIEKINEKLLSLNVQGNETLDSGVNNIEKSLNKLKNIEKAETLLLILILFLLGVILTIA